MVIDKISTKVVQLLHMPGVALVDLLLWYHVTPGVALVGFLL